jgi:hypothetical protein
MGVGGAENNFPCKKMTYDEYDLQFAVQKDGRSCLNAKGHGQGQS